MQISYNKDCLSINQYNQAKRMVKDNVAWLKEKDTLKILALRAAGFPYGDLLQSGSVEVLSNRGHVTFWVKDVYLKCYNSLAHAEVIVIVNFDALQVMELPEGGMPDAYVRYFDERKSLY